MLKAHSICLSVLPLVLFSIAALGQTETAQIDKSSAATITVFASGDRVRFTAPSSVVQIRLEVYNSGGEKVFDNEVRGGNVLDWRLQDGQAEPLADDTYVCVVTIMSVSRKITQRIGAVTIEKMSASARLVDASQMTARQSQAIGPVEEHASLIVLTEDENRTATVIAHNGEDGQIARGRGALSFRIGDFLRGKDTEQMRLTSEGSLGIGITRPHARLDVDGLIRTSQGILFPDGTVQTTAAIASTAVPTPNSIAMGGDRFKLATRDKSSVKADKHNSFWPEFNVNEDLTVNGNIIFTPSFARDITMQNNNGGLRIFGAPTLSSSPAAAAIQFFGTGHPGFPGQAFIDSGANDAAAVIFRTAGTAGTISERMRVTATGNVGIGTTSPGSRLSVAGVIESTSGGFRFPDGTVQTTVTSQGPPGPQGPQGPQGPAVHTSAICTIGAGVTSTCVSVCGGQNHVVSESAVHYPGRCTLTSETGSCTAQTDSAATAGRCCICTP